MPSVFLALLSSRNDVHHIHLVHFSRPSSRLPPRISTALPVQIVLVFTDIHSSAPTHVNIFIVTKRQIFVRLSFDVSRGFYLRTPYLHLSMLLPRDCVSTGHEPRLITIMASSKRTAGVCIERIFAWLLLENYTTNVRKSTVLADYS